MSTTLKMPNFGFQKNQYTLHNAAPVPRTVRWCGMQITIPPVDKIGKSAAKFRDGRPIPGTFVVEDGWAPDRDGMLPGVGAPPNWSAYTAVQNILKVNEVTGDYESVEAQGGLSYLPPEPTQEQFDEVLRSGTERFEASQVVWAQHQVSAFMEKTQHAQRANAPAPPADRDYLKALAILEKDKALNQPAAPIPAPVVDDGAEIENELEFMTFVKGKALEMAEKQVKTNPDLDKDKLAEVLADDPEFQDLLRKRGYRIRKKGHLDPEARS